MSAAPAHYIRSIHSSFTAAHPPATWAASINSHNQNSYHHHLQHHAPSAAISVPHHGRRRSASIRHPPPQIIKFDPFADEPPVLTAAAPPSNYPLIQPSTRTHPIYAHPSASISAPALSVPYTVHIPAAAPTEIQRYHTPTTSRRFGFPSSSSLPNPTRTPAPPASPSLSSPPLGPQQRSAVTRPFTTTKPTTATGRAPSSSGPTSATRMTGSLSGPNISKLVAGILLNRVHAVGKPMRRRLPPTGDRPREYVKSGLSSVVSVDA